MAREAPADLENREVRCLRQVRVVLSVQSIHHVPESRVPLGFREFQPTRGVLECLVHPSLQRARRFQVVPEVLLYPHFRHVRLDQEHPCFQLLLVDRDVRGCQCFPRILLNREVRALLNHRSDPHPP